MKQFHGVFYFNERSLLIMKLRNKIAAITAAAMLALAGVGFGAWVFTKQVSDSAIVETKPI
jgi:hypothetical protein